MSEVSTSVKYLRVYLDHNLNYEVQSKNIIQKLTLNIKIPYSISDIITHQIKSNDSKCPSDESITLKFLITKRNLGESYH